MHVIDLSIALTADSLDHADWQTITANCEKKTCETYHAKFVDAAQAAVIGGDKVAQGVYSLLASVCSFLVDVDHPEAPFRPLFVMGTMRSALLDDFTDAHIEILKAIAAKTSDPELRARIDDVVWTAKPKGNYTFAQQAVTDYFVAADQITPSDRREYELRIERGLQLARSLGTGKAVFGQALTEVQTRVADDHLSPPSFTHLRLLDLLVSVQESDFDPYIALCLDCVARSDAVRDYLLKRRYAENLALWYRRANQPDAERQALLDAAEAYVLEAQQVWDTNEPRLRNPALFLLRNGIEALRRLGGFQVRTAQLHQTFVDWQEQTAKEGFGRISGASEPFDLSELARQAKAVVKDKPLDEAILAFAAFQTTPSVTQLRKDIDETMQENLLVYWLPMMLSDTRGRQTGFMHSPLDSTLTPELKEAAIRSWMFWHAHMWQEVTALGILAPTRAQIVQEHRIRYTDLWPFVANNPFIPPDRADIFMRGLIAGFNGDFLTAAHLLLPQVENSIRMLLEMRDVPTTKLPPGHDEPQDVFDLNRVFNEPALHAALVGIFGEDLVFELRGLLVERFGSNLRNRFAHGLMGAGEFYSPVVMYFWWLTLRIVCAPTIIASQQQTDTATPSPEA